MDGHWIMWPCYGVHTCITMCMVLNVFVLCQPVHSCTEPSLQGLNFFLEIFSCRLYSLELGQHSQLHITCLLNWQFLGSWFFLSHRYIAGCKVLFRWNGSPYQINRGVCIILYLNMTWLTCHLILWLAQVPRLFWGSKLFLGVAAIGWIHCLVHRWNGPIMCCLGCLLEIYSMPRFI